MIGVSALSSCTTWLLVARSDAGPTSTALTRDLPSKLSDFSPAFDERIRARFPIGSAVQDMGIELARNGFGRRDWTTIQDQEHRASFTNYGLPCALDFLVFWKADSQERLTNIRAAASATCL